MPIQYKINVLKAMKDKGYSSARLRKDKIIGEATIQRLRSKQSVSFEVLAKVCVILDCDIGDILTFVKDDSDFKLQVSESSPESASQVPD